MPLDTRSSNPPVVTGICDSNKSHYRSLKLDFKLKYLNKVELKLKWTKYCVLSPTGADDNDANSNNN